MYATYDFYVSEYLGTTLAENEFPALAKRASAFLDYYTFGRSKKATDMYALKMACCAIAEQQKLVDDANALASMAVRSALQDNGQERQSETVGSYSKTFRSGGESAASAISATSSTKSSFADIARMYLLNTGLLYRGRGCC